MNDRDLPPDGYGFPILDPRDTVTLSLLGHDLRAALSEVIGGLRLVETAAMDAENQVRIARTRAAGDALSLLLEQALSIMLGESAHAEAPQNRLQTDRFLDNIRLRWQGRARDLGLTFRLLTDDLPPQLCMDGALMERILANLLGNAMKFAEAGCVTCKISQTADRLEIAIRDEGPGFAEYALPRLFVINSRPDNAAKPGTGLGLQIVRDMVDRAGGHITARNHPEGGAEVTVDLPLQDQTNLPPLHGTSPDLRRWRVLVADDSPTSRLILQQFLGQMGAEVVLVVDGVEAIGRLERESFDLLLIDIEMPRMTGLDVIHHLRSLPGALAQLPVLAITAHASTARQNEIRAAGADAVLAKPVNSPIALGAAVAKAMAAQAAHATLPDIDPGQFDRLLTMAGPATAVELVQRLLEDLQMSAQHLTIAHVAADWASIRAQTHVLIALAGTAGAHRLQRLAEQLNQMAHEDSTKPADLSPMCDDTLQALHAMIQFVADKARGSA